MPTIKKVLKYDADRNFYSDLGDEAKYSSEITLFDHLFYEDGSEKLVLRYIEPEDANAVYEYRLIKNSDGKFSGPMTRLRDECILNQFTFNDVAMLVTGPNQRQFKGSFNNENWGSGEWIIDVTILKEHIITKGL